MTGDQPDRLTPQPPNPLLRRGFIAVQILYFRRFTASQYARLASRQNGTIDGRSQPIDDRLGGAESRGRCRVPRHRPAAAKRGPAHPQSSPPRRDAPWVTQQNDVTDGQNHEPRARSTARSPGPIEAAALLAVLAWRRGGGEVVERRTGSRGPFGRRPSRRPRPTFTRTGPTVTAIRVLRYDPRTRMGPGPRSPSLTLPVEHARLNLLARRTMPFAETDSVYHWRF
jgi:hypothetical protein